ncbi:hypothetical protein C7M84_020564 [Penaeus vannamei]|uniref:Uncharacterized protein n=1 Tax=Penaeus vannamei TaxID=6689 RepID=A0A3R7LQE6_PENVA|nr:hypothetical protein C7M84_020564 [Penaeus vannamei]
MLFPSPFSAAASSTLPFLTAYPSFGPRSLALLCPLLRPCCPLLRRCLSFPTRSSSSPFSATSLPLLDPLITSPTISSTSQTTLSSPRASPRSALVPLMPLPIRHSLPHLGHGTRAPFSSSFLLPVPPLDIAVTPPALPHLSRRRLRKSQARHPPPTRNTFFSSSSRPSPLPAQSRLYPRSLALLPRHNPSLLLLPASRPLRQPAFSCLPHPSARHRPPSPTLLLLLPPLLPQVWPQCGPAPPASPPPIRSPRDNALRLLLLPGPIHNPALLLLPMAARPTLRRFCLLLLLLFPPQRSRAPPFFAALASRYNPTLSPSLSCPPATPSSPSLGLPLSLTSPACDMPSQKGRSSSSSPFPRFTPLLSLRSLFSPILHSLPFLSLLPAPLPHASMSCPSRPSLPSSTHRPLSLSSSHPRTSLLPLPSASSPPPPAAATRLFPTVSPAPRKTHPLLLFPFPSAPDPLFATRRSPPPSLPLRLCPTRSLLPPPSHTRSHWAAELLPPPPLPSCAPAFPLQTLPPSSSLLCSLPHPPSPTPFRLHTHPHLRSLLFPPCLSWPPSLPSPSPPTGPPTVLFSLLFSASFSPLRP